MNSETRQTLRHAVGVILMRVLEIGGGLLFVTLVPRQMGPKAYGQFSLLQTLSMWFSLMGGLGTASMMTHFVPPLIDSGDRPRLRKLVSGMLALRALSGTAGIAAYAALAILLLHATDYVTVATLALGIGLRAAANPPYTLFLGLNQAARWGFADTARVSLVGPATYIGYRVAGLRGACVSLLAIEAAVLVIGLWWARSFISWSDFRIDKPFLLPYLRFSTGFFFSNVLGAAFRSSGGLIVFLMSGGFAQAGYFTLAFGVFATSAQGVRKLLNSFGAYFSVLAARRDKVQLVKWIERLMKVLTIASVLACAGVITCGEWIVRTMVGPSYAPVTPLLMVLSIAGILFMPGSVTPILAVVLNLPRIAISAMALQAISFGLLCLAFVPSEAGLGACWAVVCAVGLFSAYSVWQIRQHLQYSLRSWFRIILIAIACTPLLYASRLSGSVRLLCYVAAFGGLIFALRIITFAEVSTCVEALPKLSRKNFVPLPQKQLSNLVSELK